MVILSMNFIASGEWIEKLPDISKKSFSSERQIRSYKLDDAMVEIYCDQNI